MKKIILIGKNGQLGSEIIKAYDKNEIELFPFDKNSLNIINDGQVQSALENIKPDYVINTSAFHVVPLCEDSPLDAFHINCVAVNNIAKKCNTMNIRLISFSTDYVFDGTKNEPYKEDDRPNPLQIYGLSKLAGEYAALNANSGRTYIIRTNGVYGGKTGSRSKGGNFVLNILREISLKDNLEISSEHFANPTSAIDLALATVELIKKEAEFGIYHLASEGYCSWSDFAKKILEYVKLNKSIIPVAKTEISEKLKRPKFSVLDNIKGKKIGIILPKWEDSLKKYIKSIY